MRAPPCNIGGVLVLVLGTACDGCVPCPGATSGLNARETQTVPVAQGLPLPSMAIATATGLLPTRPEIGLLFVCLPALLASHLVDVGFVLGQPREFRLINRVRPVEGKFRVYLSIQWN